MTSPVLRLLLSLMFAFLLLCGPRIAVAKENDRLFIDLEVEPGEVPSHLCVLQRFGSGDETSAQLAVFRSYLAEGTDPRSMWRFAAIPEAPQEPAGRRAIRDALRAMTLRTRTPAASGGSCGGPDVSVCDPGIQVVDLDPKETAAVVNPSLSAWESLYIRCATNRQRQQGPSRVAVLFFNFHPAPHRWTDPGLFDLSLDGTVASFQLKQAWGDHDFVEATPIGGHYTYDNSSFNDGRIVRVRLIPRCRTYDVETPPFEHNGVARTCARISAGEEHLFSRPVDVLPSGRFTIDLPYLTQRATKTILVNIPRKEGGFLHRFEGRWSDTMPPRVLRARAKSISFSWKRHCLFPTQDVCPKATLSDVGVSCGRPERHGDICRYTCGVSPRSLSLLNASEASSEPQGFSLPTRVRFEAQGGIEDTWEEQLSYGGQKLTGYVKADERYLVVDVSRWSSAIDRPLQSLLRRPGEQIDYVVVSAPGQQGVNHKPDEGAGRQRIRVPGVRCNDVLTYRIIGDRRYKLGTTRVLDGGISIDPPSETADDMLTIGITAGLGGTVPVRLERAGSRALPNRPFGVIQGIAVIRALPTLVPSWPWYARPLIELRAGLIATTIPYFPLTVPRVDADQAEGAMEEVWLSRYPIDALLVWPATSNFYFGLGGGAVLGHPFSPEDYAVAGALQASFAGTLLLGYRLGRSPVSLEGAARVFASETVRAYEDNAFRGEPVPDRLAATTLLFELKLRAGQ